jgi:hypothetical protein
MNDLIRLLPHWTFAALVGSIVLALLILAFRVERVQRGRTMIIFREPPLRFRTARQHQTRSQ